MEETVQKKYVACCITVLMYPICGATLNFRLNPFLSFVLDDTVPEFFLFADTMAAERQLQKLALGWASTWGARLSRAESPEATGSAGGGERRAGGRAAGSRSELFVAKGCFSTLLRQLALEFVAEGTP